MEVLAMVVGCLLAGAAIGFAGGVLGIGGGLLAIPLLGLLLGMDQQLAQGTALIMVLPAVLLSIRKYNQRDRIDWRSAAMAALTSILFTWIGARIALGLDPVALRRNYAVFVLGIAVFYLVQVWRHERRAKAERAMVEERAGAKHGAASAQHPVSAASQPRVAKPTLHILWYAVVGCIAGLTGGIFGVGGSVVVVPLLTTFFGLTQIQAQGMGLSMITPGIVVALATYASHGQADWLVGASLALGSMVLVPYGVRLAYRLPEARLKLIFACMLLVIMVLLLLTT